VEYTYLDAQEEECPAKSWKITANALTTKTIALDDTFTLFKAKVKKK